MIPPPLQSQSVASAPPALTRAPLPRRPPSSRVSIPRVSKEPVPLTSKLPAVPKPQPTAKPVMKTQYRSGRPPRTEAQAQADARRSLPHLPSPAPSFVNAAPRSHHVGMMLPPPVPPHALSGPPAPHVSTPLPMPPPRTMPAPLPMHPPPLPRIRCATPACRGSVAVAGKRCMLCVKGSWLGRKDAWVMAQAKAERDKEKARKKLMSKERKRLRALELQEWERERARESGMTPNAKTQKVTIKLKLPPKAKETASEDRGKGKAAEAESVDEKAASEVPEDNKAQDTSMEESDRRNGEETAVWDGAGWDSELSALTNSDSESEVEVVFHPFCVLLRADLLKEPPRPSLKIRIPARTPSSSPTKPSASPASGSGSAPASTLPTPPASVGGTPEAPSEPPRLCTIARCRRPLPPLSLYRWKCCSPCRKQYREYQRARLGRLAATNAAGSQPFPAVPLGPNGTPPPPSALPGPAPRDQSQDRNAEIWAQKEWEREENRRALEVAGAPVAPRKLYREPYEKPKAVAVTWSSELTSKSQRPMEGARVCTGRGCEHIIPSEVEYDSTMCGGCRGHERRMAERVLAKEGKLPALPSGAAYNPKDDLPLLEEAKPGRCMYADCGILISVDPGASELACEQCVRRRNVVQHKRLPGRPPGARNMPRPAPDENPSAAQNPPKVSPAKPLAAPKKRKRSSPYPAYQSCEALLRDFSTRFHGFIEAQSFYFLLRAGTGPQPPPESMFDFSGEYSVVATDLNVVARKAELEAGVHDVKDAVARAGGLEFSPTSWVSILSKPDGVVTRFACVHLVTVFLPIRMPPGHPETPSWTKTMQGELEVAVLPDDSHKYFPGEKTIVRFRLVG
ncbi:hypothetical protein C8R45DRAFT_998100 [Mycena sanguinolenta]|nr:hypothetical protein C8R45DRAFT_998100 [Mycena sanguinolenta]